MSDAIGGVVNVALIVFFLAVIALYMAFTINYQKAFNMKNDIINVYEKYDGKCDNDCVKEINEYAKDLGYSKITASEASSYIANSGTASKCSDTSGTGKCTFRCKSAGYCVAGTDSDPKESADSISEGYNYCYFEIVTFVNIEIPLINNLMNLKLFQVTGQTSKIKILNNSCESLAGMGN